MFFKDFILFSERREQKEKERERNVDVKERHQLVAFRQNPQTKHVP